MITAGARVAVRAVPLHRGEHAADAFLARVARAHVQVVALERRPGSALAKHTLVPHRAVVAIGASHVVEREKAAGLRQAGIRGTYVPVVACKAVLSHTNAPLTLVARCAHVDVVALSAVKGDVLAYSLVARIGSADVPVVAHHRGAKLTLARRTHVTRGAKISVAAWGLVDLELAPPVRQAVVSGARV